MLIQFGCGFLFGVSITFLKEPDGLFTLVVRLNTSIASTLFPPFANFESPGSDMKGAGFGGASVHVLKSSVY
jgi:hypothetical protein